MTTEIYSIDTTASLEHYGVRGMKWGVRRSLNKGAKNRVTASVMRYEANRLRQNGKDKKANKLEKRADKIDTKATKQLNKHQQQNEHIKNAMLEKAEKGYKSNSTKYNVGSNIRDAGALVGYSGSLASARLALRGNMPAAAVGLGLGAAGAGTMAAGSRMANKAYRKMNAYNDSVKNIKSKTLNQIAQSENKYAKSVTKKKKTNRKQVDKAIKNLGGNVSKYRTTGVDQYGRVTTLKFDV